MATAEKNDWVSGELFSVDGTLTQAWADHKSFVLKDDEDDNSDSGNFKGKERSNDTHASSTDPDACLYCKDDNARRLLYMEHAVTDNRHGLVANVRVTIADGYGEREAAKVMLNEAIQATDNQNASIMVTVGAEKGYGAQEFSGIYRRLRGNECYPVCGSEHLWQALCCAGYNRCHAGLRRLAEKK